MLWLQSCVFSLLVLAGVDGGWLGVYLAAADRPTISEVVPDSPAFRAGLKEGDVFLAVDGSKVDDAAALVAAIGAKSPGDRVELRIARGDGEITLKVTLGKRPGEGQQPQPEGGARRGEAPAPQVEGAPGGRPFFGLELEIPSMRVTEVSPNGPADRAGVERGDVIGRIGDTDIADEPSLDRAFASLRPGARVEVVVTRGDAERTLELVVGSRPSPHEAQPSLIERAKEPVSRRAPEQAAGRLKFGSDYRAATDAAKLGGAPVLVVFGATWCAHCQALKRAIADPRVQKVLTDYERVWIDTDRQPKVADEFEVRELPTLLVQKDGETVVRKVGYQPVANLLELLGGSSPAAAREAPAAAPPERNEGDERPVEPGAAAGEAAKPGSGRAELEAVKAEVDRLRQEIEALEQVRKELDKVDDLDARLTKIEKMLERLSRPGRID